MESPCEDSQEKLPYIFINKYNFSELVPILRPVLLGSLFLTGKLTFTFNIYCRYIKRIVLSFDASTYDCKFL